MSGTVSLLHWDNRSFLAKALGSVCTWFSPILLHIPGNQICQRMCVTSVWWFSSKAVLDKMSSQPFPQVDRLLARGCCFLPWQNYIDRIACLRQLKLWIRTQGVSFFLEKKPADFLRIKRNGDSTMVKCKASLEVSKNPLHFRHVCSYHKIQVSAPMHGGTTTSPSHRGRIYVSLINSTD